jgi:hypothetical protein
MASMEHYGMELKAKRTSGGGRNLWKNNEVEFFDLTPAEQQLGTI